MLLSGDVYLSTNLADLPAGLISNYQLHKSTLIFIFSVQQYIAGIMKIVEKSDHIIVTFTIKKKESWLLDHLEIKIFLGQNTQMIG